MCAQQENTSWNIDASVGAVSSAPSASFSSVPGIASPGNLRYDPVSGATNLTAGLGVDLPVHRTLRAGLRLDVQTVQLRYDAFERAPIAIDGGGVALATLQHNLQTTMTLAGLTPYLRYEPVQWLSVGVGLPLMSVTASRFNQTMVFSDPAGLRFVDGSIEQVTARGRVPNLRSVIPSISMFAEAQIKASPSGALVLLPRVSLAQALTSITTDGAFNVRSVAIGVGLRYRLGGPTSVPPKVDTQPTVNTPPLMAVLGVRVERDTFVELTRGIAESMTMLMNTTIDTATQIDAEGNEQRFVRRRETYRMAVPKPPSVLRAALQLQFIDEEGQVTRDARLSAVRVESRRVVSFVPAIVFDNASTEIPERYQLLSIQQARTWKEGASFATSTAHWQYDVLNVIGARMKRLSSTTCTLIAVVDDQQNGRSAERIASIRSYLASRFGIRESRIQTRLISASEDASLVTPSTVVIDQASPELLAPTEFTVSTIETQLPRLQLLPDVISEAGVRSWSISALTDDQPVRTFSGSGTLPASVAWDMNEDVVADAAFKKPLVLTLQVEDVDGDHALSDPIRISLTSRTPLSSASRPVKRTEILTFAGNGGTLQSSALRQGADAARPLAEWTMRGLEPAERALYEQRGMRLSVQVLERR
jgi:hypothetical protein